MLLGEATHGSAEFYRARAAITRRLIERHGFTIVAVEADWPDAARIDDYVRHKADRPRLGDVFTRFPTWMWRNLEVLEFADWLRARNGACSEMHVPPFAGWTYIALRIRTRSCGISIRSIPEAARSRGDAMGA